MRRIERRSSIAVGDRSSLRAARTRLRPYHTPWRSSFRRQCRYAAWRRVPAALAVGVDDVVVVVVVVVVVSACDGATATAAVPAATSSAHAHASRVTACFKKPPPKGGTACRAKFAGTARACRLAHSPPAHASWPVSGLRRDRSHESEALNQCVIYVTQRETGVRPPRSTIFRTRVKGGARRERRRRCRPQGPQDGVRRDGLVILAALIAALLS